jgi:phage/plasmid-like protein (TIGR03299 family)
MAHMITDNMISFCGKTPWHGLGTRVEPHSTPDEMLKAAKLDWTVSLRSLAVSTDVVDPADGLTKQVWRHSPMVGFKGVMRSDTNECFAVPTRRYQPVQNIEVARFFHDYADATSCELQVVGGLEGGRKVWALAKVASDYQITAKASAMDAAFSGASRVQEGKDIQLGYVMLATSHDGSLRTVAMGTSIYVVCWNTMSAALSRSFHGDTGKKGASATFALKHTSKFDESAKRQAVRTVGLVKEQLQATATMADTFARIELDDKGRIEFVRRLLGGESAIDVLVDDHSRKVDTQRAYEHAASDPSGYLDSLINDSMAMANTSDTSKKPEETRLGKQLLDMIVNSPGNHLDTRANTLWGAVNGVTYYADHERGRTVDSTLNQAWFGQGANLKAQAVQVAYDMAGIRA